ncbi:MAG: tetratricopeptide repeat protein [Pyrinomonadaceae bacterium]|nr:tetratricopeptide repeat protein [Pyrinomonadaceae bacterium]
MKYFSPAKCRFLLVLGTVLFLTVAGSAQSQGALNSFNVGLACPETDFDCKINNFSIAIELDPTLFQAYLGRAIAYRKKGMSDQAHTDLNKVLELNPDSAAAYYFRGLVNGEAGKYELALADFNKTIKLAPDVADSYNNRGFTYRRLGNNRLALEDFDKAIQLYGDSPNAAHTYLNRGLLRCSEGCSDLAIADYNKAIQLNPNYAEAYVERGSAYDNKQRFDLALADYNKALQLNPELPRAYNGRGWVYHQQRLFDRAIADYTTAIRIDPGYATAYCNRGVAYASIGEYDLAIEDDTKALDLDPDLNDEIYRSRALAYFYKNDGENAYRDTVTYLKRNGVNGEAVPYGIMIGYLGLRKTGNTADADTFLKDWLKLLNPGAWSTQILKYFDGQMTAEELLKLANNNDKQTEAHAYIGEILLSEHKKADAFKHFEWVKQNGNKTFIEYRISLEELGR